jgi:hypothetical protein
MPTATPGQFCRSFPCANGGVCRESASSPFYTCTCPALYTGNQCESRESRVLIVTSASMREHQRARLFFVLHVHSAQLLLLLLCNVLTPWAIVYWTFFPSTNEHDFSTFCTCTTHSTCVLNVFSEHQRARLSLFCTCTTHITCFECFFPLSTKEHDFSTFCTCKTHSTCVMNVFLYFRAPKSRTFPRFARAQRTAHVFWTFFFFEHQRARLFYVLHVHNAQHICQFWMFWVVQYFIYVVMNLLEMYCHSMEDVVVCYLLEGYQKVALFNSTNYLSAAF